MNAVAAGKASSKKFKIDTGGYTPRPTAHYQFKA
jgi:hypothetical protein